MATPKIILTDSHENHQNLLPLTYTRPVADLLVGINTLRCKWEMYLPGDYHYHTEEYLREKFPAPAIAPGDLLITSNVVAEEQLAAAVAKLQPGQSLTALNTRGEEVIVAVCKGDDDSDVTAVAYDSKVDTIDYLYDIFLLNSRKIEEDFEYLTRGREGQSIHRSNTVIGDPDLIYIESGAIVEGVVLNVSHGPIYVGRDVEIMEGSCLRGPIALGAHSTVNMGSKIYPGTTLGPWCKVGGELNNVVMLGYSNKAHDGFLGNAVIGEWCNLGAGCVASNLKNDYTEIKLWNYPRHRFLKTGLQFCGLMMGDHSKAGINTMFNTATVVGVGVNIHGSGFPRNFIASFSEGGAQGFTDLPMEKFLDTASRMMARRHRSLSEADIKLFNAIRHQAENYK
ncbi:MAG: glucose-1-phosphate thymidylyltransferase [Muribaculaceae bacterium]|nr:glucose-1-phosphate thymidylyltransferase [Muribaculaceae bacterium]